MIAEKAYQAYDNFKEKSLEKRRFKHKNVLSLLENLTFQKETVGQSFEKRKITKVKIGDGPKAVMLWSQMHGNEATATMAMFDLFHFFNGSNDGFDEFRSLIKKHLSLHFIPMLNPDGAERFTRRTAQQIDMNRDALALQAPESVILKNLQFSLKPAFSFNLHDQNVRYSAGQTKQQAAISFLATAYNFERSWNKNRTEAMQVICQLNDWLQTKVKDKVGRFTDEFEPRAFGDNIQLWGSSLILIESGGFGSDSEKQYLRKLNFCLILQALEHIALEDYHERKLADYEAIPTNEKYLFDLLIKNVMIEQNGSLTKLDIGINIDEVNSLNASDFTLKSCVEDMGDLSVFWGIEEFDAQEMTAVPVHNFPDIGYKFEINTNEYDGVCFEKTATFLLTKNEIPKILVLNGKLIQLN